MICAKNYENTCKFIKVINRIVTLFPGHGVLAYYQRTL